jgi:RNA-directed DNA polymerase
MISLGRWPKVEALREKLNGKAKAEPNFRFYLLHDKLHRKDVLEAAYAQCRQNGGACGADGVTFEKLEESGVAGFLDGLSQELKTETYAPSAVKRVLIPKAGKPGEFRPLGIPTIKDRVVQQAAKLLLEPIFEADLPDNAYGYRPGKSAHDAVKAVHQGLKDGYLEVVDADLSKYFDTIPHDQLMRSVERRIVDRRILALIRGWLKAPVHVRDEKTGKVRIEGGQATKVGTPQGGVISPLLANIYFRRVLRAWEQNGYGRRLCARIVNYADDFVILTRNRAQEALEKVSHILRKIGLTLNDRKTRICHAPEDEFSFLGFTFARQYSMKGQAYVGLTASKNALERHREKLRALTGSDRTCLAAEKLVKELVPTIRGFWQYFSIGARAKALREMERFAYGRMKSWMKRKHPKGGRWREELAETWPELKVIFMRAQGRGPSLPDVTSRLTSQAQC